MKEIIDFAQWYSGMDRDKVERAYQRYLKESATKLEQRQHLVDLMKTDEEHGMYEPIKSKDEIDREFIDMVFPTTAEEILQKLVDPHRLAGKDTYDLIIQAMEEYKNSGLHKP